MSIFVQDWQYGYWVSAILFWSNVVKIVAPAMSSHLWNTGKVTFQDRKLLILGSFVYGSSHTKLGQLLILRVVVCEYILSILIFISPP